MEDTKRPIKVDIRSFLVISIALHLMLLLITVPNFPDHKFVKKVKPIQLKFINNSTTKSRPRQIVETIDSAKNKNQKADYLGKKNTAFDRQTRARNTGKFKKAGAGTKTGSKKQVTKRIPKKEKSKVKNLKFSDLALSSNMASKSNKGQNTTRKLGLSNGDVKTVGPGRSSDFVKDIPLGDFTKLNTQEYEFYGFYHRIRQKLEQFWGRNLQEQADRIYKSGRSIASDKNHITSLVIKLNSKGEIIKVHIRSTSGVSELDNAAVNSFNQAGPFPNPPRKMLKGGIATIEWSFVVNS